MHGGEYHDDPIDVGSVRPSWTGAGAAARPLNYPVLFRPKDSVRCAHNGHIVTFTEHMQFDTEEELQTYICDCIIDGTAVNV